MCVQRAGSLHPRSIHAYKVHVTWYKDLLCPLKQAENVLRLLGMWFSFYCLHICCPWYYLVSNLLLFFFWQERFQVKNPPHTYLQKLRSYLDPAVTRKVRALVNIAILFLLPGQAVPLLQFFLPLWPSISCPGYPYSWRKIAHRASERHSLGTLVTKQAMVGITEKRDHCLSGTPRFEKPLPNCSVISQDSESLPTLISGAVLWLWPLRHRKKHNMSCWRQTRE